MGEALESRDLLAVFTVVNTADAGPDSLREAIVLANQSLGADEIHFNIPGSGRQTIELATDLPIITETVTLDGTTQPGYAGQPLIELTGATSGNVGNGLNLERHFGSTVRGLAINHYQGNGIWVFYGGDHVFEGNYIGTSAGGDAAAGGSAGIYLITSERVRIGTDGDGTDDEFEGNLLSGNSFAGIAMTGWDVSDPHGSADVVISGNLIGTDATGAMAIPNEMGIYDGGIRTRVGVQDTGDAEAQRNIISGNRQIGYQGGFQAQIAGNYLGTNKEGDALVSSLEPNRGGALGLSGGFVIVGTDGDGTRDELERNLIAGSPSGGAAIGVTGTDNVIAGNWIGLNAAGNDILGNQSEGNAMIFVQDAGPGNRIGTNGDGTSDENEANVIASLQTAAIRLSGAISASVVAGNRIQSDANGDCRFPGLSILLEGVTGHVIGTNGDGFGDESEGNLVCTDLMLSGAAHDNTIAGNQIRHQIQVFDGSHSNRIGTNGDNIGDAAERNIARRIVISGIGSNDNVIAGNYVGVAADGVTALPGGEGIQIESGAAGNRIGTNADGNYDDHERNLISGNTGYAGVFLYSAGNDNWVAGNSIGTTADGLAPLPNEYGVLVLSSGSTVVGGTQTPAANLIAYNSLNGVGVASPDPVAILGNQIHSNGELGIDLAGAIGVDENDPLDADVGTNGLQNFPVLSVASLSGSQFVVTGALHSAPSETFRVELFASAVADLTGHGEGARYLGAVIVTTDGDGNGALPATPVAAANLGELITATATDSSGNTSEFSLAVPVVSGNAAPVASVSAPSLGVPYQPLQVNVSASDSPTDELLGFNYQIDWGDGTNSLIPATPLNGNGVALDHAYALPGSYSLEVTATDAFGAVSETATSTITVQTIAVIGDDLVVGGTAEADVIHFARAHGGDVKVFVNGDWTETAAGTGRVMAYGGPGHDLLSVGSLVPRRGWLFGGPGNDILNGGVWDDVLNGGEGDDHIFGGSGRDLIIGGTGADHLFGNFDEDLILAGSSLYQDSAAALAAITAEWTSGRSFQQRVANLSGTGSGSSWTGRSNGNVFLVADSGGTDDVTVFDDQDVDLLVGGQDRDWVLANLFGGGVQDLVADLTWRDLLTDLDP